MRRSFAVVLLCWKKVNYRILVPSSLSRAENRDSVQHARGKEGKDGERD